jgi:hypothetical protein
LSTKVIGMDGHAFYSYNHQLNMLWKSGRIEFDESFPMRDERVVGQVAGLVQRQGSLQEALLGK